ncbi:MAG: TlpA family protein disulfide reductase [Actinomycetota bacterium]
MRTRTKLLMMMPAALLLAAACGNGDGGTETRSTPSPETTGTAELFPVFASSELVVGENRFLLGLLDSNDAPIGSPDISVKAKFFFNAEEEPRAETDLDFIWIDKPVRGLFATQVTFDTEGQWTTEIDIEGDGYDSTVRSGFPVLSESATPAIGEQPPASDTPTADDVKELSKISTDKHPDPAFYQVSIADALESGEPFVVVFATPKFCVSQTCGPMLDIVQDVAEGFAGVTFIHVEPYDLDKTPEELVPVDAAVDWGLPSEPWVFVMDDDGRVAAKFEGVLSTKELRNALSTL